MTGKTDEEFASQKKALEEKEAEVLKLNGELEKAQERVENAQKKIHEWEGEIGGVRKSNKGLTDELADAQKTIEDLKTKIEKVAPKETKDDVNGQVAEEKPEDIEKSLNEDQKKVGLENFEKLSDDEKIQYDNDPAFKLAFLKRLKKDAPVVPTTPWSTAKKTGPKVKSGVDVILDRVFEKKKQASGIPEGPIASGTLPGGKQKEPEFVEDDRVS